MNMIDIAPTLNFDSDPRLLQEAARAPRVSRGFSETRQSGI